MPSSSSSLPSYNLIQKHKLLQLLLVTFFLTLANISSSESIADPNITNLMSSTTHPESEPKSQSNHSSISSSNNKIKTVYLIRHAESEENRRLGSLKTAFLGLGKFKLPAKKDVLASMELLNVSAQIDSDVSEIGQQQVSIHCRPYRSLEKRKKLNLYHAYVSSLYENMQRKKKD